MHDDPEPEWLLVEWLRLIEARWSTIGISRRSRAELMRQLRDDLAAARAAGARIEELTATPPAVFADSIAAGLRSRYSPISTPRLVGTCLVVAVGAAGPAWLFLSLLSGLDLGTLGLDEGTFYTFVDLFLIAAVLALMVAVTRWIYRSHIDAAALTPRLAVALTVGTLTGLPLASAYQANHRYSPSVLGTEAAIVLLFLAAAVVVAQRWTTRPRRIATSRQHSTT